MYAHLSDSSQVSREEEEHFPMFHLLVLSVDRDETSGPVVPIVANYVGGLGTIIG
jgi:hypothetical protein